MHCIQDHRNDFATIIDQHSPDFRRYEEVYRRLHRHPELPKQEKNTANTVSEELESIGFTVHRGIGGFGVVGILRNRPGKTVLLRSELDALPIEESTGLDYSSNVRMEDEWGKEKPVSHACGHDMNISCLLASSALLKDAANHWSGTLIVLFQPNEEYTGGAKAMIEDGLYDVIPRPDVLLAQHVVPTKSGTVQLQSGPVLAAADSINIRLNGNGPGKNPNKYIDPIFVASNIVMRLPALKGEPGEITGASCWSVHAGTPGGDYPSTVDMLVDVKSYTPGSREKLLDRLQAIVIAECDASGLLHHPEISQSERAPLTDNDPDLTESLKETFSGYFQDCFGVQARQMASEDFPWLATAQNCPYIYWNFGATEASKWEEAQRSGKFDELVPINHSPYFAPVIQPTLKTGTQAMALAALTFLY